MKNRESQIEEENKKLPASILDEKSADVESATNAVSQVTLAACRNLRQKAEFVLWKISHVSRGEIRQV